MKNLIDPPEINLKVRSDLFGIASFAGINKASSSKNALASKYVGVMYATRFPCMDSKQVITWQIKDLPQRLPDINTLNLAFEFKTFAWLVCGLGSVILVCKAYDYFLFFFVLSSIRPP